MSGYSDDTPVVDDRPVTEDERFYIVLYWGAMLGIGWLVGWTAGMVV